MTTKHTQVAVTPLATAYTTLPTGVSAAELDEQFEALLVRGKQAFSDFMRNHTLPGLQAQLTEFLATKAPPALGSNQVVLTNGDPVRVVLAIGGDAAGSPGAAAIIANHLDFVQLS